MALLSQEMEIPMLYFTIGPSPTLLGVINYYLEQVCIRGVEMYLCFASH